ncbi:MAG: ATP-binding protein [Hyphomonadaceae bacterium]|nr:ATP-binding protein [Hyphomonadaceae bacterium]
MAHASLSALAAVAEARRREAPTIFALTVLAGGLGAFVVGPWWALAWTVINCGQLVIGERIYLHLSKRESAMEDRHWRLLAAWAFATSVGYATLPLAWWLDGHPALTAAAMATWLCAALKGMSDSSNRRIVALADAAPFALCIVLAPAFSMATTWADFGAAVIAIAAAAGGVFYVFQFWRRTHAMDGDMRAALAQSRRQESLARLLFDQSTVSAALFDKDMRLVSASGNWLAFFQTTLTAVQGRTYDDIAPWQPQHWRAACRRALAGETVVNEEDEVSTPFGPHIVAWEVRPWREREDGPVSGIVMYSRNVTAAVRTRRASEAATARLEIALESARTCVWEFDTDTKALTWYGDPVAIYGRAIVVDDISFVKSTMIHPEDLPRMRVMYAEMQKAEGGVYEYRILRPGGEVAWIHSTVRFLRDAAGRTTRVVVVAKDVTAQKGQEIEFIETMRRAQATLEMRQALIAAAAEACGDLHFDAEDPVEISTVAADGFGEAFARLRALMDEFDRRDASLFRALESLSDARHAAETANRAKTQFLANITHELRTPLNAIIGYSELLRDEAEAESRDGAIKDLDRILGASRHLLTLINEILDLSKIEAGRMEVEEGDVDLAGVLKDAVAFVRPMADKRRNVIVERIESDLGVLRTDGFKLKQCVLNLLSNAAKFTQEGTIGVSAARMRAGGREWVRISVSDTGVGINAEDAQRLFEEFSQADASTMRKFGGTGLGLAITRRIMRLLGGDVHVASAPQRGSVFTLHLPLGAAAQEEAADPRPFALVIDSDAQAINTAQATLTAAGFAVESATSIEAALSLAHCRAPALAVIDPAGDVDAALCAAYFAGARDMARTPILAWSSGGAAHVRSNAFCAIVPKTAARDVLAAAALRFATIAAAPAPALAPSPAVNHLARA